MNLTGGAARRRGNQADKAYAVEDRLNNLGLWADGNGFNRYTTAVDGNTYCGGTATFRVPPAGYTGTASLSTITGLQSGVAAANYRVDGELIIGNGGSVQAINFGTVGPGINDMRMQFYMYAVSGATSSVFATNSMNVIGHWTTTSTMSAASSYLLQFHGFISFSAASGTVFGIQTSAPNAFTIGGDSYMDLRPV